MEEIVFAAILVVTALVTWMTTGHLVGAFTSVLAAGPLLGSIGYLLTYRLRRGDWGIEEG